MFIDVGISDGNENRLARSKRCTNTLKRRLSIYVRILCICVTDRTVNNLQPEF